MSTMRGRSMFGHLVGLDGELGLGPTSVFYLDDLMCRRDGVEVGKGCFVKWMVNGLLWNQRGFVSHANNSQTLINGKRKALSPHHRDWLIVLKHSQMCLIYGLRLFELLRCASPHAKWALCH